MLRPSKLFVSFHQLRHFFQTKISELVQPANHRHTPSISQQPQVQRFFALFHQPTDYVLLSQRDTQVSTSKALQKQFPLVKTHIHHTIVHHRRPALWTANGQQSRNMMSATGPTHTIGCGFCRPFSTTKTAYSPIFQSSNHVSSRIFSPAGGKMNTHSEDNPPFSPKCISFNQPNEAYPYYNRIFAVKNNGGMRELVNVEQEDVHHYVHHLTPKKRTRIGRAKQERIQDEVTQQSVYLLVQLELSPITSTVDPLFIRWLKQRYEGHMDHVLDLLGHLSNEFKVVVEQGQLRVYFPSPGPKNKREAAHVLETMGVRENETYSIEQEEIVVGPEYFKKLQLFIDHIDTLIDHGPAFNKHVRNKTL